MSNESFIAMTTAFDPDKIRKFAATKDYNLKKVRNKDLYDLIDTQTGICVVKHGSLYDIHTYLCGNDD